MIAVHPVAGRQDEQLDEGRRLPALPTVPTDGPRANRYAKAAEQPHPHRLHVVDPSPRPDPGRRRGAPVTRRPSGLNRSVVHLGDVHRHLGGDPDLLELGRFPLDASVHADTSFPVLP